MLAMSPKAKAIEVESAVQCCAPSAGPVLGEVQAATLARIFAAVADPVRLRLLSMVTCCEAGEICACDLTTPVGRSQPTISHHMKVLYEAGLVEREKRGLWVWYRSTPLGRALIDLVATDPTPSSV
jgi:ArsR family transcriptional regulator